MGEPYYSDDTVALYLGDMREVLPALGVTADLIVADPPYGETSLAWDRWPDGWLDVAATASRSLWCFGSMRMFLNQRDQFSDWTLSHDVIWEKPVGTAMQADRFKRVHEYALHWYRGRWADLFKDPQREKWHGENRGERHGGADRGEHFGSIRARTYVDDGTRLVRSVIKVPAMRGRALHPTEKPVGILDPLIRYGCRPGGVLVDPFAGSGSSLEAARLAGRRAIGVEAHEPYAEKAAMRLSQMPLEIA